MNIKDFLIDNYIYIIVVIVLIIITVIGFLADRKKNGAKKMKDVPSNVPPVAPQNVQPMTYQPMTNNINASKMPNMSVTPVQNNNPGMMPQQVNPVPTATTVPTPQPQPMPQPTMGFSAMANNAMNQGMVNVQPVNPMPQPQMMATPQNINPTPVNNPLPASPVNMPTSPNPMPIPNPNINNNTIPRPMPANPGLPTSPMPMPSQPSNPPVNNGMVASPVGFVYGNNQVGQNNGNR